LDFSFFTFGYFFGSIPFGYIISKAFFGKDIREYYSKNIGATNVSRVLGKKVGIIVFILDFLKAYLPSLWVLYKMGGYFPIPSAYTYATVTGIGAVFGHLNPYLLQFKGGKGVACFFGCICALNPFLALSGGAIWLILFLIFKISAISSLISISFMTTAFFLPFLWKNLLLPIKVKLIILIITLAIFLRHTENIIRLVEKKEYKL
jgi:glycerol-3-phosphate acyltransferase PlsY